MLEPIPFRSPVVAPLTAEQASPSTVKLVSSLMVTQAWIRWLISIKDAVDGWHPPSTADIDAQPNTVYYSTDAAKLVYKDSLNGVHNLY